MLTIVYCTRATNPEHQEHLINSSGLHKNVEVIEIINNGESLTSAYNRGLSQAKYDHVVFSHDDITITTKNWGNKLLKLFAKNPEYGILGVAGSKTMPTSGKWWENPKKMYGRVQHTHEGKTWLSAYSNDLGQTIEETVVVDGLFFAVDKTKLKKVFDETVTGFHFYELTLCFDNYLENVKIGVTTIIRVNHKSIGATNNEWELNRQQFVDKFADKLPVTIKKVLRKGEQLKIMLAVMTFDDNSPKSKIIFELANKLKTKKHDVTICANVNGKIAMLANRSSLNLAPIQQPPGFVLGDGKWMLKTQNGDTPSVANTLYKVKEMNFNVIHTFDENLIAHMNKLYGGTSIVNTKFTNGLFVSSDEQPMVNKTINLSLDTNDIKNIDVDKIIEDYVEVL